MKYLILTTLAVALFFSISFAAETPKIENENDKVNYSLGYQIGGDLKREGVELKSELVVKGIQDAIAGTNPLMTPQDMRIVLVDLKKRIEKAERDRFMKDRKIMYFGMAVFAAAVTPDPTPVSMLILWAMLVLLFEFGIFLARLFERSKK